MQNCIVNYSKLQVCDTEGMIEAEYENRAWQLRSGKFFPPHFHCCFSVCFFFINFLLFCFVYTFKELTEVHKCVCAVYGPNTAN